jgi:ABC-type multidrug transport system permease subunit
VFPFFIVIGFAFAFSGQALDLYKVGVISAKTPAAGLDFLDTQHIQFIPVSDLRVAITKVERHQLDMLLDPSNRYYWVNDSSPRGYILERVLRGSHSGEFSKQTVSGQEIRYVDWLIPGVLGMNMMFSALFGIGYVIVRYRKNGMLKRLKATPLTPFEFLAAQIASRWCLIMVTTLTVYVGTDLLIDFRMLGSYFDLVIVFALGAISLISLAMVIAARTASEELAGGLLNVLSWPMIFLSGVWFSLEGIHPLLQKLALILPLTHLVEAARAIMIDGAGLLDIATHLLALAVMSGIFLAVGSYLFRWEQS